MSELNVDTIAGSTGTTVTIKSGHTLTLAANMSAGSNKITNVTDPTGAQDAATKNYVDTQLLTLDTLGELTNVTITSVADNEVLAWDSSSSLWINQTASEAGLATSGNLTTHTSSTSNPHSVTAAQAAAIATADLQDDDNFSSPSASKVASSESIKAYVDAQVDTADALSELSGDSDDVSEGSTNLYYLDERVDDRVNTLIVGGSGVDTAYDDTAGTLTFTADLSEVTSDLNERIDDRLDGVFVAGTGLTKTYDDTANTYTVNLDALTLTEFAAATIVTEGEGNGSNDDDNTIPTSAAVKDFVDTTLSSAGYADIGLIIALG